MVTRNQLAEVNTAELALSPGHVEENFIDPATISALVSAGALLLDFVGHLVGGKTGDALSGISAQINGLNDQLISIANKAQQVIMKVEEVVQSVDAQSLALAATVHDRVIAYNSSFPTGAPALADVKNINYIFADTNSKQASTYFQNIGASRGPITFMPSLCHVTNTRIEVAANCWQCWWAPHTAQPNYVSEVNLSAGQLAQKIGIARPRCGDDVVVKQLKGHVNLLPGGPDGPPDPIGTIGWQVIDGGKVVFSKLDPNASGEASNFAAKLRAQKAEQVLSNFEKVQGNWVNLVASAAPAGIQRALNLGDAKLFMRYINPSNLAMVDSVDNGSQDGTAYRALPLRDVLLDMLTSGKMKERHGLLVKGADQRSVKFWFDKTFHREPSPSELASLLKVVEIFGYDSLFGCLAYSGEYQQRYGDGLPSSSTMTADLTAAQKAMA